MTTRPVPALDPTDAQAEVFRSHCGAQRVAYNWALARVRGEPVACVCSGTL